MDHARWKALGLAVLLAGLLAVGAPHGVAVASDTAHSLLYQGGAEAAQPAGEAFFSLPGVLSLSLGQGLRSEGGAFVVDSAQVDLPALNATATVNGLTLGFGNNAYGWDSISVQQAAPAGNEAVTIADTQIEVQGKSANYSTDLSTRIDVHPSEAVQAGATLTLSYDGSAGTASFGVADGGVQVAAGPASVMVDGLNLAPGASSVDAAQIVLPNLGVGLRLDGYQMVDGKADWQALTWYGNGFNLGNVLGISDTLVVVPGPSAAETMPTGAMTNFQINGGELVQADGQVRFAYDRTTRQPSLTLLDANATLGSPEWNVALSGINAGKAGASVDTVLLTAEPLNVQAQVNGLTMGGDTGVSFDQAALLYLPDQPTDQAIAGFQVVVDNTDAGYVVTSTTLLPKKTQ